MNRGGTAEAGPFVLVMDERDFYFNNACSVDSQIAGSSKKVINKPMPNNIVPNLR